MAALDAPFDGRRKSADHPFTGKPSTAVFPAYRFLRSRNNK
ncbi:MAG: hypothetical protein ABIS50_00595 [Luteolibacter sp.]